MDRQVASHEGMDAAVVGIASRTETREGKDFIGRKEA